MAEILPMLALSPTMEEGTIVKWEKKEGDEIASGDLVCEVETDKAVMDYEAAVEGKLLKILAPEGSAVAVGDAIAIVGKEGEDVSELVQQASRKAPTKAEAKETQPAPAEPVTETAPAAPETPSTAELEQARATAKARPAQPAPATGQVKASPLARKLAAQAGLDIRAIQGTGPGGRIVKRDVEQAGAGQANPAASAPAGAPAGLEEKQIPISPRRRTIAQRLSASKFAAPHYYLTASARVDALLEGRRQANADRPGESKLSLSAFLIKIAAMALARHPMVNASWGNDAITLHGSADIGLAVALDNGLITPIVRNCVAKGVEQIDAELADLIQRARSGKLAPEEFTGATFSISNLGNYGIEQFTAIINPPGSAILAVGQIAREPVVAQDDQLEIRSVMRMTLSCDHRVIDGAVGAAFLKDLADMLESPIQALL